MKWLLMSCILYGSFTVFGTVFGKWEISNPPLITFKQKKKRASKKPLDFDRTLPDPYLDQVIHRKKTYIHQCATRLGAKPEDILIEIQIQPSGNTKARLIHSTQVNKAVLKCTLDVLDRIQFKKFSGLPIIKSYHFQFR